MADRPGLKTDRRRGEPPYDGKLQLQAYQAGRKARLEEGAERGDAPPYTRRSLTSSWEAGWDDAGPPAAAPQPPAPEAPAEPRRAHPLALWPEDKAMPAIYTGAIVPCPFCRRFLDDEGRQAVLFGSSYRGLAHLRCRCCGKNIKMRTEAKA